MKKESLGLYLYERLLGAHENWTDPNYGDNPDEEELLTLLYANMVHEVQNAWNAFLAQIGRHD